MFEGFRILREELGVDIKRVTITITKSLEAKERYWLNVYGIEEFEVAKFDKLTGQVILKVSTCVNNEVANG